MVSSRSSYAGSIVLVAVAGAANRSLLLNTEYRGIPAKKLHQFLIEHSEESNIISNDPVYNDVNHLFRNDNQDDTDNLTTVISQTELEANNKVRTWNIFANPFGSSKLSKIRQRPPK